MGAKSCAECGRDFAVPRYLLAKRRFCSKACSNKVTGRKLALPLPVAKVLPAHIDAKIDRVESGCWEWTGAVNANGYGIVAVHRKTEGAHRVVYEILAGSIPAGLHIDHLCRNRRCVNPAHLEPVTQAENNRRAMRTHCLRGHEFTPENTYRPPRTSRAPERFCRQCQRDKYQARKAAKVAEVA
jgi:hypothetical protein